MIIRKRRSTAQQVQRGRRRNGRRAGGVYLWETRAAAEAAYNSAWKARVKQFCGSEPEISWFDTPIVDNQAGGVITKAA